MSNPTPLSRIKYAGLPPTRVPRRPPAPQSWGGGHRSHLDPWALLFPGVLPGIAEQVLQRHLKQSRITLRHQPFLDHELYLPLRLALAQLLGDAPRERGEIDGLPIQLTAGHPGELKQVIDELPHALARGPDPPQIALAGFIQLLAAVLQQCLAEAVNTPQRRPQVVGDGVAEGLQLFVGGFDLHGSLFELLVKLLDPCLRPLLFGDIPGHPHHSDHPARLVTKSSAVCGQPLDTAIGPDEAVRQAVARPGGHRVRHSLAHSLAVFGMNEPEKGIQGFRGSGVEVFKTGKVKVGAVFVGPEPLDTRSPEYLT